jgi:diguanylate cyclase (GGDEF)-like protein
MHDITKLHHSTRRFPFRIAQRHGWTMAIIFMDLDAFKKINNLYGHEAGDVVLTIANRQSIGRLAIPTD